MDPPGYRPSRQNRDWCDIDRPKSMFRQEHRGRFESPPRAESEEARLRRDRSLSRHVSLEEGPPPSLSTLIARHRSQIRWRKAEEAHERMILRKLEKRSGRVSKPSQKSTQKRTDLAEAIRRGEGEDGKHEAKDKTEEEAKDKEEEELNAKLGNMSLRESGIPVGDMPNSPVSHLAPIPELETSMGSLSLRGPDTSMGGDR